MNWRTEWKAISDRIEGLLEAGLFFAQLYRAKASDCYGTVNKELLPHARDIFHKIEEYRKNFESILPQSAVHSIVRFIDRHKSHFEPTGLDETDALKLYLSCLASFRSEFTFCTSDIQAVAKRITERAFLHLQRSIIADQNIKERWVIAFDSGEIDCEKLGAVHLLLHGIWAFKASGPGEQTDLILREPLNISEAESAADALVLTEWKVVRNPGELIKKAQEAFRQASVYSRSLLGGLELAGYRYLVLVSQDRLSPLDDRTENGVVYRHINITVQPSVPSKMRGAPTSNKPYSLIA